MGGPIAAIVLHELFDLGVRRFLRIGTAMAMPPAKLGDFVVAEGAVRGDGASLTYAPLGYPAIADYRLVAALRAELIRRSAPWKSGLFGTYDGFYTQMFSLSGGQAQPVEALRHEAQQLDLIATDMETATLLVAGRRLGAEVASLCLATVNGLTQDKLDAAEFVTREREMFEIALDVLAAPLDGASP
jgi:uridine phosphorylase